MIKLSCTLLTTLVRNSMAGKLDIVGRGFGGPWFPRVVVCTRPSALRWDPN
jgi:hypothetical protein